MKTCALLVLALSACCIASADFSYTSTRKTTGGMMAAVAGSAADGVTKVYFKGQKMKTEDRDNATLIDFDAQTITIINNVQKTIVVRNFGDVPPGSQGAGVTIDAKETGQRKIVNGFDAKELLIEIDIDASQGRGAGGGMGGKMQVEVDLWISSAVPGGGEMRAFYQKNSVKFPWAVIGGNNSTMQSALAEVQKKIASMDGVTVEQIIRMKSATGSPAMPAMPQMTPAQQAQMAQARSQLEALQKQGGPGAAMAAQALARMGGMPGGAGAAPGINSTSLLEMTVDSGDFSTSSVPDSVFVLPADYRKVAQ